MSEVREIVARAACIARRASDASPVMARQFSEGFLAALDAAGYVVVPRKPTKAMYAAAYEQLVPALDAQAAWVAMADAACADSALPHEQPET